jgi:hypothetical protein
MSVVGPSVSRSTVGGLFQRFISAVTRRPEVNGIDDALRTRLHDGTEPSTALLLGTLNRMFGRPFAFEGHVPSPGEHYGSGLGSLPTGRGFTALGGLGGDTGFASTTLGQSLQAALDQDPEFRAKLERALGGTLLNTGASDGRLLVHQAPAGGGLDLSALQGAPRAATRALAVGAPANPGAMSPSTSVAPMAVMQAASAGAGVPGVPSTMGPIMTGLQQMEANIKNFAMSLGDKGGNGGATFDTLGQGILGQAQVFGGDAGAMGQMPFGNGMFGGLAGAGTPLASQNVLGAMQTGLSDTMRQQMLQKMISDLRKMYELLSNILKQMHEMQKTAIDNVKAG